MTESQARPTIPIEWGQKARCPNCSTPGLSVVHQANSPDQLHCRACGFGFELEMGGNRLHITQWPISLFGRAGEVGEAWLTVGELDAFVHRSASSAREQTRPEAAKPPAAVRPEIPSTMLAPATGRTASDTLELDQHVKSLRSLGNSYKQIRTVLAQTIGDPARLKLATEITAQLERQEQGRQQKKVWLALSIVSVLLAVMAVVIFMFPRITAIDQPAPPPPLQATAASGIVEALHLATPAVYRYPTLSADDPKSSVLCPRGPRDAASLFGGLTENWSFSNGGWIMINPAKAATITIPNGMKAAYLTMNGHLSLAEVEGPAKMENVYYVAVSCP
ncbi:MAG TPA: hypothetical protein VMC09_13525 [Anaerolineales bacterium]|nr:hypothetical protein [Anaerolineales bacterium]